MHTTSLGMQGDGPSSVTQYDYYNWTNFENLYAFVIFKLGAVSIVNSLLFYFTIR